MSNNFAQLRGQKSVAAVLPLDSFSALAATLAAAVAASIIWFGAAPDCAAQTVETSATSDPQTNRSAAQIGTAEQQAEIKRLTALIETEPNKTEHYIERGKIYRQLKQLDRALADFSRAVTLAPEKTDGYYWRAWLYQELQQLDRALLDFDRIVELEPNAAESYNSRAWAYEAAGEFDKAAADRRQRDWIFKQDEQNELTELTREIQREPSKAENYRRRAEIYLKFEQRVEAIADYDQILKLEPGDDWIRKQRAYRLAEQKQFDRALADYDLLIKRDFAGSNLRLTRGEIYLETKQFQRAVADFTEVIKRLPADVSEIIKNTRGNWRVYQLRADAFEAVNDLPKAVADRVRAATIYRAEDRQEIVDLNRRIKADPKNADLYRSRALSYSVRGQHRLAIADLTSAIRLAPDDFGNYSLRAAAYEEIGEFEKARADRQKADELISTTALPNIVRPSIAQLSEQIKNQPGDAGLHAARANLYFDGKQFESAIADFTRALELDSAFTTFVLNARAESFLNLKRYPEAIADYTALLAVKADAATNPIFTASINSGYYIKRAEAYLQSGQFDQAIADFDKIVADKPNDQPGYRLRAFAFAKAKRFALAIADYSKLISIDPTDAAAYRNRAAAREQAGEFAKAAADRQVAAAIDKL